MKEQFEKVHFGAESMWVKVKDQDETTLMAVLDNVPVTLENDGVKLGDLISAKRVSKGGVSWWDFVDKVTPN